MQLQLLSEISTCFLKMLYQTCTWNCYLLPASCILQLISKAKTLVCYLLPAPGQNWQLQQDHGRAPLLQGERDGDDPVSRLRHLDRRPQLPAWGGGILLHRGQEWQGNDSVQSKVVSSLSFDKLMYKKRSRARVTKGGQSVVLQNSPKLNFFDFFCKAKITVWITSFHTYFWAAEKIVKILETRL